MGNHKPSPRLVRQVQPLLDTGETVQQLFVAQVGRNPVWLIGALPVAIANNLALTGSAGAVVAATLTIVYFVWLAVVFVPLQSRVVAVTHGSIAVFDATKLRFKPKQLLRRVPRETRLGPLEGVFVGPVDLGGERAWVSKGYRGVISEIDGVEPRERRGLPPRQRLFGGRDPKG